MVMRLLMESSTSRSQVAPYCNCGNGRMKILPVKKMNANHGRLFFRCPLFYNHNESFIWVDEYQPPNEADPIPDRVFDSNDQKAPFTSSCGASESPQLGSPKDRSNTRFKSDLEAMIALFFMVTVIFLLGMIFGRLSREC